MASIVASHVAYSDEARFNYGRYRGLALVGARVGDALALSRALRDLLETSGMEECKWEKVRSARARFAAAKLLRWAVERAIAGEITVDEALKNIEAGWEEVTEDFGRDSQIAAQALALGTPGN